MRIDRLIMRWWRKRKICCAFIAGSRKQRGTWNGMQIGNKALVMAMGSASSSGRRVDGMEEVETEQRVEESETIVSWSS
jgi:hypothetical protein